MVLAPGAVKVARPSRERQGGRSRPVVKERFDLDRAALNSAQVSVYERVQSSVNVLPSLAPANLLHIDDTSPFAESALNLVTPELCTKPGFAN